MTRLTDPALSVFSDSYEAARAQFLRLAEQAGARCEAYSHPNECGADGRPLTLDTAWLGPSDATTVMVMLSGTHGPESYAGSAIQLAWLQAHQGFQSPSMAMLLVHGVNPYGWAHSSRTNEHHIDLNRNFTDHPRHDSPSRLTQHVQNVLSGTHARGPRYASILFGLLRLLMREGMTSVVNEISNGQYSHPQGIGYGGDQPAWSNRMVTQLLSEPLSQAKNVAIIDWHTGIGDYAQPCFLCFDAPQSPAYQRARQWWGEGVESSQGSYVSGQRPDYQGLLINAARDIAQSLGADTTAAVIEMGTYGNLKMLNGLLIDRWLRCDADHLSVEQRAQFQQQVLRLFYPADPYWRQQVLAHGSTIIQQTLAGLSADQGLANAPINKHAPANKNAPANKKGT